MFAVTCFKRFRRNLDCGCVPWAANPEAPVTHGIAGWQFPKQMSTCQHTVAKNDIIGALIFHRLWNCLKTTPLSKPALERAVANASWCKGEGYVDELGYGKMGQVQVPQLEAMAKFDPDSQVGEFAASLGNIMENGSGRTTLGIEVSSNAFEIAKGTLFGPEVHFASVPIRVQGQPVATMCVMDRNHHR